jgi:hypothetical protein
MRSHAAAVSAAVGCCALVTLLTACSGDEAAPTETTAVSDTVGSAPTSCAPTDPVLRVDTIDAAVAAVEAELGGPQRYYEINATDLLVNLFVVGADPSTAIPFVFVGDALSSDVALTGASGNTFSGDDLDFDPRLVTSCVMAELPESVPTAFEIVGGPDATLRYSVLVTSQAGGQLIVEVTGTGTIVSVDPV